MSDISKQPDAWQPCRGGEIRQVLQQTHITRRNRAIAAWATSGVALLAVIVVVTTAYRSFCHSTEYDYGGITCSQTRAAIAEYLNGSLDQEMARRVSQHLAQCAHCKRRLQEMQDNRAGSQTMRNDHQSHVAWSIALPRHAIRRHQ